MSIDWLNAASIVVTIVTAIVALLALYTYRQTLRRRVTRLEEMLARKNRPGDDSLTIQQCAAEMGCTIEQVLEAASHSKKVESWAGQLGNESRFRMKQNL